MARKKKNRTLITSIFALLIGLIIGFISSVYISLPDSYEIPSTIASHTHTASVGNINSDIIKANNLSIHFLELGNKYTGDCTLIKVGTTEMLIDAGSKASSIPYIKEYLDRYVEGALDYVVITHAHEDHYAGFATNQTTESLFDIYEVETIIDFGEGTNKTTHNEMFENYIRERNAEIALGATYHEAIDYINGTLEQKFEIGESSNIYCEMLYHKFYNKNEIAETENDYSVCFQIINGDKKYLFTGDLEKEGEESLVAENKNSLSQVELYKAGHHGSKTSSHNTLLEVIKPKNICVCCCAGSSEYTVKNENQFPTQEFINRVSKYTSNIYVTTLCIDYKSNSFESFNGTIVYCANNEGLSVSSSWHFSNNSTKLKDTLWFKSNRKLPANAVA